MNSKSELSWLSCYGLVVVFWICLPTPDLGRNPSVTAELCFVATGLFLTLLDLHGGSTEDSWKEADCIFPVQLRILALL